MKKCLFSISLLSLCLGCANVTLRTTCPAEQIGPYRCTSVINEIIADPFKSPSAFPDKAEYVNALFVCPVAIIDWPFDAVVDTLLYPYDNYMFYKDDKKEVEQ